MESRKYCIEARLDSRKYDLKDRTDEVFDGRDDWRHFGSEVKIVKFGNMNIY